ncbi:methyl-accepting chemotaxis protein [Lysinibacillus endophyticus]|uniref:methyl-accepting chemotaxis protein n=1 Tax=Ureibacillus endophyticus TaxID=1978490 RepID=UPI00209D2114|nr:methyl-accepting chemotaxis protein [Lysinibacillus endophyticus]MCP1144196.1 methyl-accepting chemotaxis protein [Lysinibacillus endophyticus]
MRFSIKKKMWMGFSSILFLLIAVTILAIVGLFDLTNRYKEILEIDMQKIAKITEIEQSQRIIGATLLEYVTFEDPESLDIINSTIEERLTAIDAVFALGIDDQSAALIETFKMNSEEYFATNDKLIEQVQRGRLNEATFIESKILNEKLIGTLDELKVIFENDILVSQTNLESFRKAANTGFTIVTIISILLGILISSFISKMIASPILKVTKALEEVANGNFLIEPIKIKNNDETGTMAETFNKMLADIRNVVTNVRSSSIQLATNAEQLSSTAEETLASSQMVSSSAEQQMLTSEEQSNLMHSAVQAIAELNDAVSQIASDNELMLGSANGVQKLVKSGSAVVTDVVHHMNNIHDAFSETSNIMKKVERQSNEIQRITSLITEISDQTNLLALNAAIEAARAGEYGKGFAVVAEEVRKLAEQSKNSAIEITSMVQQIQSASSEAVKVIAVGGDKVDQGLSKTSDSLEVFNQIETSVGDVVVRVESVSTAIEQIHGMAETVLDNVHQIQNLANNGVQLSTETSAASKQQIAANEEISSSAEFLAELAERLQVEVEQFKI